MRQNRRLLAASALLLGLTALLEACGGSSGYAEGSVPVPTVSGIEVNQNRHADPATFYSGALNQDALAEAREFDAYPLLWLGEKFEGFYLMKFVRVQQDNGFDSVHLIYGECQPAPGMSEPSCVPPISVSTTDAGWVPDPDELPESATSSLRTERGVDSIIMSGAPVLWTGGVVVTVNANSELERQAIDQLQTVNHTAMGRPAVQPGDSLATVGE